MGYTFKDLGPSIFLDAGDARSETFSKNCVVQLNSNAVVLAEGGKRVDLTVEGVDSPNVSTLQELYQFVEDLCLDQFNDFKWIMVKNQILNDYGDYVSFVKKSKFLQKFGRNPNVGTDGATVMTLPTGVTQEQYLTTNGITHFASDDAADTGIDIVVEGHTIDGSGNLTFVSQTVTTDASNGQTKTALTTPLRDITRAYNNGSTELVGNVSFAQDVTFTAGVPVAAQTHLIIRAGKQQSEKCASATSSQDYFCVSRAWSDVIEKASAQVSVEIYMRQVSLNSKVFRKQGEISASNTARGSEGGDPIFIIPKNHDFKAEAIASGANIDTAATIAGHLAIVIGSTT